MLCTLADVGWGEALDQLALIAFTLAGVGVLSGVSGMLYGLVRPTGSTDLPVALGLLAMLAGLAFTVFFWAVNGDNALAHPVDRPVAFVLAAVPLLLGASAIALAATTSGIRGHWLITVLLLLATFFVSVAALLHSFASG